MAPAHTSEDAPSGEIKDDSYVSRRGAKDEPLPVVSDTKVEDPIDSRVADSDEQLERDDKEAIDPSNLIEERTRGVKPVSSYREPGDEEGLPENDGTSSADMNK